MTKAETESALGMRRHLTYRIMATYKGCSVYLQKEGAWVCKEKKSCVSKEKVCLTTISLRHVPYEPNVIFPEYPAFEALGEVYV